MQQLYHRHPVRFEVRVDGRTMGQPYRNSGMAHAAADALHSEAPWTVVEVVETF